MIFIDDKVRRLLFGIYSSDIGVFNHFLKSQISRGASIFNNYCRAKCVIKSISTTTIIISNIAVICMKIFSFFKDLIWIHNLSHDLFILLIINSSTIKIITFLRSFFIWVSNLCIDSYCLYTILYSKHSNIACSSCELTILINFKSINRLRFLLEG